MILLFAKAAGCSWTTTRVVLQMFAANRGLSADDLARSFERYKKLSQKTALSIVKFQGRSPAKRRPAKAASARVQAPALPATAEQAV
jgi:phospholipase C